MPGIRTADGPTVEEVRQDFALDLAYNAGVDCLETADEMLALASKMGGLITICLEAEYSAGERAAHGIASE